ncbi:MAG: HAMP domain-containing histidine kinase [Eubacterium sp.]|nr:HAMP domain-containing histidine kinase [Eubacterium sp.]
MPCLNIAFSDYKTVSNLDTVEVNAVISEIEKSWGTDADYPDSSFDYAVLDDKEEILYKNGNANDANSIVKATSNRDTIRDIIVDDKVVGKLIIYNHMIDLEKNIEAKLVLEYLGAALVAFIVILLAFLWIELRVVKPFDSMKEFAVSVASGDLDKPLMMDRLHLFGAFTESFDIMREELAVARERELKANISKKELVAQLSHDIKTPVASIKAMSELLSVKEDREELRTKIVAIGEKADHIDRLVSNLFTSTMQELDKMEVSTSDMESTALEQIINETDNRDLIKSLEIPECIFLCDRIRVTQVISNIIYNSYKYANTNIYVHGKTDKDTLSVSFTDRGGGVKVEELGIITKKYKRGANAEGIQGTGLGLAIAKELMENMEGSLEVANADGGFRVTISFKLT